LEQEDGRGGKGFLSGVNSKERVKEDPLLSGGWGTKGQKRGGRDLCADSSQGRGKGNVKKEDSHRKKKKGSNEEEPLRKEKEGISLLEKWTPPTQEKERARKPSHCHLERRGMTRQLRG